MAVSTASFKVAFPEFTNAPDPLVDAAIARVSLSVPSSIWGDDTDKGIELSTAQWLALSPFGRGSELVSKDGSTVYDARLDELRRKVAGGPRLA